MRMKLNSSGIGLLRDTSNGRAQSQKFGFGVMSYVGLLASVVDRRKFTFSAMSPSLSSSWDDLCDSRLGVKWGVGVNHFIVFAPD